MSHLVLSRKTNEAVQLKISTQTDDIEVWVNVESIKGEQVRLSFDAPETVKITREELIST